MKIPEERRDRRIPGNIWWSGSWYILGLKRKKPVLWEPSIFIEQVFWIRWEIRDLEIVSLLLSFSFDVYGELLTVSTSECIRVFLCCGVYLLILFLVDTLILHSFILKIKRTQYEVDWHILLYFSYSRFRFISSFVKIFSLC